MGQSHLPAVRPSCGGFEQPSCGVFGLEAWVGFKVGKTPGGGGRRLLPSALPRSNLTIPKSGFPNPCWDVFHVNAQPKNSLGLVQNKLPTPDQQAPSTCNGFLIGSVSWRGAGAPIDNCGVDQNQQPGRNNVSIVPTQKRCHTSTNMLPRMC